MRQSQTPPDPVQLTPHLCRLRNRSFPFNRNPSCPPRRCARPPNRFFSPHSRLAQLSSPNLRPRPRFCQESGKALSPLNPIPAHQAPRGLRFQFCAIRAICGSNHSICATCGSPSPHPRTPCNLWSRSPHPCNPWSPILPHTKFNKRPRSPLNPIPAIKRHVVHVSPSVQSVQSAVPIDTLARSMRR